MSVSSSSETLSISELEEKSQVTMRLFSNPQRGVYEWKGRTGETMRVYVIPDRQKDAFETWIKDKYGYMESMTQVPERGQRIVAVPVSHYAKKDRFYRTVLGSDSEGCIQRVLEGWAKHNAVQKAKITQAGVNYLSGFKSRLTCPDPAVVTGVCQHIEYSLSNDLMSPKLYVVLLLDYETKQIFHECDVIFPKLAAMNYKNNLTKLFLELTTKIRRLPSGDELLHYIHTGLIKAPLPSPPQPEEQSIDQYLSSACL